MEESPRSYDYVGRSNDELSWFEKATRLIPGYRGYAKKEKIRATDALIREQITEVLYNARNNLAESFETIAGDQPQLGITIDKLTVRLDMITQRVKHATQGYSSLFDPIKVKEDELERLTSFDVGLMEYANTIIQTTNEIKKGARSGTIETNAIDRIYDLLDEFETMFSSRDEHLLGLPR